MKIFVVAGKAGSGKGEVARFIKEYYIYKFENTVITEYSKYIKSFAKEMTDWDGTEERKPREFLQNFGVEIRKDDKYFFTRRMLEDINIYTLNNTDVLVISDARMPDEIDEIKKEYPDMHSIYVVNQFKESKLTPTEQAHITEIALENYPNFDLTIANDGTLDDLKQKVFTFLEGIDK